ncbi:uncharacterized protein MELLADRAFT_71859 [Melampsora larici-populina 98AG31]|uniref:Uncharacterized protein n=1 Tax=Melampsora larici-populina (strain 98AG31 / pathotype 3-4-7) TaxID=747676 RepID=F4RL72_MELLP|nr:uncharacterized protein MELLADRAFT_71859 [Melampsora larici-populina 98AG31]EGG06856.1 hypothetical protein MELLADRAFT_71859 [Melampsora larici-populina 98AG31]
MFDPMISPDPFPLSIPNHLEGLDDQIGQVASLDDKVLFFSSEPIEELMINSIDHDLNTCWKIKLDHRIGIQYKFIGLNFIAPIFSLNSFQLIFNSSNPSSFQSKLNSSLEFLSSNSTKWERMDTDLGVGKIGFKVIENAYQDVKKIKLSFRFHDDDDESSEIDERWIEICGWMINEDWIL